MANALNVLDRSIWVHDSELDVAIHVLEEQFYQLPPDLVTVFWVYPLQPLLPLR